MKPLMKSLFYDGEESAVIAINTARRELLDEFLHFHADCFEHFKLE